MTTSSRPACAADCPDCARGRIPDGQPCTLRQYLREVRLRLLENLGLA
jgi:hypothetical protein